ncbi:hypothetical protein SAMN04487936_1188 [Halobacillus dabanensis]|uniref:N-acetyltransferase domain-containing protein n=1 Tax=Halobacillus dabanensis TaxID=240302 RepID=A0A1I4AIM6_HALDA|nr:GNAT family N-acetyltransferase [Halobacillus dabanensis]SFK56214.1 hypothetical protein SAMN04487936_1188 [Halobacillus dabanensis]
MTISYESDLIKFFTAVEPLLLSKEAENNLPLGILERMKESGGKRNCDLIYIQENDKTTFMSIRTAPHLWIIPSLENGHPSHLEAFAKFLFDGKYEVPGVIGNKKSVQGFLEEWEALTGQRAELQMEQGIHQLNRLKQIPEQPGELIVADFSHQGFLEKWIQQYGVEVGESYVRERVPELTKELIETQRLHLWVIDGQPVSMASRARSTKNGATINAVYTPDEFKRNGYASQVVWHLTNKLLGQGYSFCSLYTDLANPTSNSIYKKIGYERVGDSVVYHFPY